MSRHPTVTHCRVVLLNNGALISKPRTSIALDRVAEERVSAAASGGQSAYLLSAIA